MDAHETEVCFCGRFTELIPMFIQFYEFPMVSLVVAGVIPPLSLPVRLLRISHYRGNAEEAEGPAFRKRYERTYEI